MYMMGRQEAGRLATLVYQHDILLRARDRLSNNMV